jgi:hypothetical protein
MQLRSVVGRGQTSSRSRLFAPGAAARRRSSWLRLIDAAAPAAPSGRSWIVPALRQPGTMFDDIKKEEFDLCGPGEAARRHTIPAALCTQHPAPSTQAHRTAHVAPAELLSPPPPRVCAVDRAEEEEEEEEEEGEGGEEEYDVGRAAATCELGAALQLG